MPPEATLPVHELLSIQQGINALASQVGSLDSNLDNKLGRLIEVSEDHEKRLRTLENPEKLNARLTSLEVSVARIDVRTGLLAGAVSVGVALLERLLN
jgi:hypothetical protein